MTDLEAYLGRPRRRCRRADLSQRDYFVRLLDEQLPAVLKKYKEYVDITQRIADRLRVAEDIHSITMPEGEQQVGVDFYLRNGVQSSMTIEDMLKRLRGYADVANRLYGQLSAETLGRYKHLYSAASDAARVRQPLVTRFELVFIGFGRDHDGADRLGGFIGCSEGAREALKSARQGAGNSKLANAPPPRQDLMHAMSHRS